VAASTTSAGLAADKTANQVEQGSLVVDAGKDRTIMLPFAFIVQQGKVKALRGGIRLVKWSKVSGGPATIQSPTAPVTQLAGLAEGQYVFRLTATDDLGNTASSEATVTVQAADPQLLRKTWMIDGQQREAVIHAPEEAAGKKVPVLIFFHGHGGYATEAAQTLAYHKLWPEALVVYPQGLPSKGGLDREGVKPGWQHGPQDDQGRDLKFFDTLLASLGKEYAIDPKQVFVLGFSNVLWIERGDVISGMAPCAGTIVGTGSRRPMPVIFIAGEKDHLATFDATLKTSETIKQLNHCQAQGKQWSMRGGLTGTLYSSSAGAPFVFAVHGGTHKVPEPGPAMAVKFFKEFCRP